MIFVSSSCSKQKRIGDAIKELVSAGVRHIELSGGTEYYAGYEEDILRLQDKYDLTYLVHNYFPPPKKDFVLNLASLDDAIHQNSIRHLRRSIRLSRKIGAKKFGFHAGFFIDLNTEELGSVIAKKKLQTKGLSMGRFCDAFKKLQEESREIDLYLENNIYSYSNNCEFNDQVPFMLVTFNDYSELKQFIDFKLLLDLAHLKVSANSLQFNFNEAIEKMINVSDYLHISDNDGRHDQNLKLNIKSDLVAAMEQFDLKEKTITLEIYDKLETIVQSCDILSSIIERSHNGK